jgi:hypothetical protein
MNQSDKRKVPEETPVDFISERWKEHLYEDATKNKINRSTYGFFHITGLHKQFTHSTNNRKPDKKEMIIIMAALYSPGRSRSPLVEWS